MTTNSETVSQPNLMMLLSDTNVIDVIFQHWYSHCVINPWHSNISMHILHTVFYTFPKVLIRRICFTIKSSLSWWSFPSFLWPWCVIQEWYCKEKFDCGHSQGSEGYFTFFSFSSQMEEMLEQQRRQQVREMLIAFFLCVCICWRTWKDEVLLRWQAESWPWTLRLVEVHN